MQGYEDTVERNLSGGEGHDHTELTRQIWLANELQATMANYLKGSTSLDELETVVAIVKAAAERHNVDIDGIADLVYAGPM